jgi:hypothetical protein
MDIAATGEHGELAVGQKRKAVEAELAELSPLATSTQKAKIDRADAADTPAGLTPSPSRWVKMPK